MPLIILRNSMLVGIATAVMAQTAPPVLSAAEIAQNAVKSIDEHYLHALNQPWKKARAQIADATAPDRDAIYAVIRRRLAELRDSELHLTAPTELAAIQRESEGEMLGTGLIEFSIDVLSKTGEARVVTPLVGSPAAIAGLRPNDVIVAVNGKPTRELDHEQVLDELRSATGSDLVFRRAKRTLRARLVPSEVALRPVVTKLLVGPGGAVAYVRILQFTHDVPDSVRSAIRTFEVDHPRGYILDLRNNPGGFLEAASRVCGFFLSGTLGAKVRRNGNEEPITMEGLTLTQAPLVLLVNEGTASASEFVAGALQGRRAIIVGARTYGRGQAQVYEPLSDGYGLIIPSALIRTPDGRLFKGVGLMPDILVTSEPVVKGEIDPAGDVPLRRAIALLSRGER